MITRRKLYWLVLPILALAMAGLACGTGYRTSSSISGNSGKVRLQMKEASGVNNNMIEISEDWSRTRISATVDFSVVEGSCRAILTGEENTSITLDAAAGSPTRMVGDLVTDSFGDIDLETDCQNATELDLTINFTLK